MIKINKAKWHNFNLDYIIVMIICLTELIHKYDVLQYDNKNIKFYKIVAIIKQQFLIMIKSDEHARNMSMNSL